MTLLVAQVKFAKNYICLKKISLHLRGNNNNLFMLNLSKI